MARMRFQGQNTDLHEHDLLSGQASSCVNADVMSQPGVLQTRKGFIDSDLSFDGPILNHFFFTDPNGTVRWVGKVASGLKGAIGGDPPGATDFNFDATDPGTFFYHDGRMYYFDKSDAGFWDFTDNKMYRVGLPKPLNIISLTDNSIGGKQGAYRVAVAYEDVDRRVVGHRSNGSTPLICDQQTNGASRGVTVLLLTGSITAQLSGATPPYKADKVQVLVTKALATHVSEGGSTFTSDPGYYYAEQRVSKASSLVGLVVPDNDLPASQLHRGAGGSPPNCSVAGVVDGIGFYLNATKPRYSLPGRIEMIADENEIANFLVLEPHVQKTEMTYNLPGKPVTVKYLGNSAIVFTEHGAGLVGRVADRMGVAPITGVPGTYTPLSIADFPGGLVYMSGATLYVLSGNATSRPGANLFQRELDLIAPARLKNVVVGHYSAESQIWVAYSVSTVNDRIIVYDYLRDQVQVYRTGGFNIVALQEVVRPGTSSLMGAVGADGKVWTLSGARGVDGGPEAFSVVTWRGSVSGRSLTRKKRIVKFDVHCGTIGANVTLSLNVSRSKEATSIPSSVSRVVGTGDSNKVIPVVEFIGLIGNHIELTVSMSSSSLDFKITGIEVELVDEDAAV
jgi:hypothetical protein